MNVTLFFLSSALVFLGGISFSFAATEYVPLVGIPGLTDIQGPKTIPQYINTIYILTITIGALAGVMRIAWAGVKYSLSEIITEKESAKKDIRGVLLGLAILLIPFIVLNTINPDLVNLDVLKGAKTLTPTPYPTPTEQQIKAGDGLQFDSQKTDTTPPTTVPASEPPLTPTTGGA